MRGSNSHMHTVLVGDLTGRHRHRGHNRNELDAPLSGILTHLFPTVFTCRLYVVRNRVVVRPVVLVA